ncbi:SGNH/GDSL hydrolase family protein [Streptomyces ipomoeae]|jgi:lysophospholipase L1-like esterase|uniref:GDSL-like protein n=2 Tax=Streptomyces ipomoeae TaxID=103232 RepID=L1KRE3_9ACTN|nr:SGNH/GDSL hydrolase family protein [Streptomyces ipomoeae]EKX63341.1 GDSL-like protein [Streptomyces ipomoeae 91-03]MDX2694095.1 SGNH/GDSL hydrolase family protein [Streptomyces ipomoeae]MDX2825638.1 SGNH/GDSL hydrolase family protein [Streptomyces ipomoeae]MDX2825645.1 SGNH/GDSL hydrolase family protein [Streptomyces ipomoeae]MDX2840041.1 SGNH/GDSL hydrolase family protein [Streptomyces ipomoeae]
MRKRRHRSRAGVGAVLAAVLLGTAACDASGGSSSGPEATEAKSRPTVKPTPTPAWDTTPESLAAVGDSITRGFDACQVLSDCPEVSWATGSDASVDSLAVRLLGASGAVERSWNYAVTGARMADLPSQMARAATRRPELVTVMIGANDACRATVDAMTPVADFRADFEDAMASLRDALPKTQVFVASVPDLKRLWSEGRTNPVGKQVWKLGICPSMLAEPDVMTAAATERRDAVQDRVEAYNDVLRDVCAKDRYCRYDGDAVFDYRFGQKQLSQWDWFHPSVDGQARLAEIAYRVVSGKGV